MLGADLICRNFQPNEEMFSRSLDIIDECGIAFLHCFPIRRGKEHRGTMPQLDPELIKDPSKARLRAQCPIRSYDAHLATMLCKTATLIRARSIFRQGADGNFTPVVASTRQGARWRW